MGETTRRREKEFTIFFCVLQDSFSQYIFSSFSSFLLIPSSLAFSFFFLWLISKLFCDVTGGADLSP